MERKADAAVVRWNKPEDALTFTLHRTADARTARTDPASRPSGWETLISGTRELAYTDGSLRHGTRYYKVVATTVGGGSRSTARPAEARAESPAAVLARADAVTAEKWTRRSFAAFTAELARIRTAAGRPGAGEDVLIDAVYAAYDLLVPVETLLRTFPVTPSMVEASTVQWPGTGTRASNGWRALDGDDATYTDTLAAESWIDIDAGDAGPVVIDVIRLLPRSNQLARADGTVVKGSDDGVIWHDLHTVSGVDTERWYEARLERRASYRRIRIYDDHDGRCNPSGIEFAYFLPDEA